MGPAELWYMKKASGKPGTRSNRSKKTATLDPMGREFRLDVYIIDSGWDCPAHRVLVNSLDHFTAYLSDNNLYVLTREQSIAFLKAHPELIGKGPIVAVVDRLAKKLGNPHGYGVRLCLGTFHDPQQLDWVLRLFARAINTKTETLDIAHTFSVYGQKLGFQGAVEIIMESVGHQAS